MTISAKRKVLICMLTALVATELARAQAGDIRVTTSARSVGSGRYEWTMFLVAPESVLNRISYVRTRNTSTSTGDRRWDWEVFVEADPKTLGDIQCVECTLHPTFPDPVRRVCEQGSQSGRGFSLNRRESDLQGRRLRNVRSCNCWRHFRHCLQHARTDHSTSNCHLL